ncbi:chromosome partitioning protein ParB [Enterobacter sp. 63]
MVNVSNKLKLVYLPLKKLSSYARNARTHSGEQVAQLVASIEEFGWTNPVLIDENGEIIAGHGRVLAAEAIGIVSVPTIKLSGLTDEQKRAYRLADNRLPQNGGWDDVLLKSELRDLASGEFDLSLIGFSEEELNALLGDVQESLSSSKRIYSGVLGLFASAAIMNCMLICRTG